MRRSFLAAAATIAILAGGAAPAYADPPDGNRPPTGHDQNGRVPVGALWTEQYFASPRPSADGSAVELHADILRPANLPATAKTPVVLTIGPYFGHDDFDSSLGYPDLKIAGPNERFRDFIDGAQLMKRGYTWVQVDLRGFGGSTGCTDYFGQGEQADIKAAIDWAGKQPWSNGRVGIYGKSYDASTSLIAANLGDPYLKAAVAQEPVWDTFSTAFSFGVPMWQSSLPQVYAEEATDFTGYADDTARYRNNATFEQRVKNCVALTTVGHDTPRATAPYWRARDLIAGAKNARADLLYTQGVIDDRTPAQGMHDYLYNYGGKVRGWIGQWGHVRGNETNEFGQLEMGRQGWFDEVVRLFDRTLKGKSSQVHDPTFAIQDSNGRWRSQNDWPRATKSATYAIAPASYTDTGVATPGASLRAKRLARIEDLDSHSAARTVTDPPPPSSGPPEPNAVWPTLNTQFTWLAPVKSDVRVTGTPAVTLNVTGVVDKNGKSSPDNTGNVHIELWDVGPDGIAVLFDQRMALVRKGSYSIPLRSAEWNLLKGHRIAIGLGTQFTFPDSRDPWVSEPTGGTVRIGSGTLTVSTQNPSNDKRIAGDPSVALLVPYKDLSDNEKIHIATRPIARAPQPPDANRS
ncbi:CocE/NonD family hydrolase [Fodinicola acaciae]|uniref:CocE/NonD family hydrolase n=1 Tax=Fodinicola acaciae TaxID=2681555 RepID=UPI0013D084E9|nr:CocE/NonD family hydrolase [Fodinicola acaciae]